MADTSAALRWTVADLELFPDDSQRYEILDGELFVSRASHIEHQRTCGRAYFARADWNRQMHLGAVISAPGIIFADADSVIPDLVWMSHAGRAVIEGQDGHLHGAPELIVEVLSPRPYCPNSP